MVSTFGKKLVEALSTNFYPFLRTKVRPWRIWLRNWTFFVQKGGFFVARKVTLSGGTFLARTFKNFHFWKFSEYFQKKVRRSGLIYSLWKFFKGSYLGLVQAIGRPFGPAKRLLLVAWRSWSTFEDFFKKSAKMVDFLPDLARIGLRSVVKLNQADRPRRSGFWPNWVKNGQKWVIFGHFWPKKAVSEIDRQSILAGQKSSLTNLATTFCKKVPFCTFCKNRLC